MILRYSRQLGVSGATWELNVSDNFEDSEVLDDERRGERWAEVGEFVSFGDYAVISPGVQIILEGRPVSRFS